MEWASDDGGMVGEGGEGGGGGWDESSDEGGDAFERFEREVSARPQHRPRKLLGKVDGMLYRLVLSTCPWRVPKTRNSPLFMPHNAHLH
jgi:hypothetical protein